MSVSKIAPFLIPPIALMTGSFIGMTAGFIREIRQINDKNPIHSGIKTAIAQNVELAGRLYVATMSMALRLVLPFSKPVIWPTVGVVACIGLSFVPILKIKNIAHDVRNRTSFHKNTQKKLTEAVDPAFQFSIATAAVMSVLVVLVNFRAEKS